MEDRFCQQLKKGILELLTLRLICKKPAYGYELLIKLREESDGALSLKEGTLYPILYRLEDEGLIVARWSQGEGRVAPKKIYEATPSGFEALRRRREIWMDFQTIVNTFLGEDTEHDG